MKVENRVKSHIEFQKVIHDGEFVNGSILNLYYLPNNLGKARVGISVPTKIGCAVVRNKIRRQIRAILSSELDLTKPYDLIFIVRRKYSIEDFVTSKEEVSRLLEKVGQK